MTTYILYTNGVLEQDGCYLPADELNPDYRDYLAWLTLGNTPALRPASEYLEKIDSQKSTRQQIRTEYQTTIDQLATIENATNPTNAQVIAAIKFIAKTSKLILKILAYQLR